MYRFKMPSSKEYTKNQRVRIVNEMFNEFLSAPSISKLIELLGGNPDTTPAARRDFIRSYSNRGGMERQGIKADDHLHQLLEDNRSELYQIFMDLGMLTINTPITDTVDRIMILGASRSASYNRTARAAALIKEGLVSSEHLTDVSSLGAYRIIAPIERNTETPEFYSNKETEFGILCDAMEQEFALKEFHDDFSGNINTNKISCIRSYKAKNGNVAYKVYAAPGDMQRADSYKSYVFYLENNDIKEHEKMLLITNNVYVNYQFIPFCMALLEQRDLPAVDFDIIGISPDSDITSKETYNPYRYLLDLTSVADWIYKFKCAF